jgi:hypothetical protein
MKLPVGRIQVPKGRHNWSALHFCTGLLHQWGICNVHREGAIIPATPYGPFDVCPADLHPGRILWKTIVIDQDILKVTFIA